VGAGVKLEDPKIKQFSRRHRKRDLACTKIISDLLDFAASELPSFSRAPSAPSSTMPLRSFRSKTRIVNAVPEDLPVPAIDKDHFGRC